MFDLNTSILDPAYDGELDSERLEEYINSLMAEFSESPEGEAVMAEFDSLGWAATYMDFAASYFLATPATVTLEETDEIIFEIFPRKVSVEPEAANQIVTELRAFWRFLKRTRSVKTADAILELLTDEAVRELEAELEDPDNFGLAKSLVMSAIEAGVDIHDPNDLNRYMCQLTAAHLAKYAAEVEDDEVPLPATRSERNATIVRESPHVGRNDACPCGSGRKYKNCCMR